MLFREALDDFYAEQEYKGNRPATLTYYRVNFDHFVKDTGVQEVSDFSEKTIRTWLVSHRGLSPNTLVTYDRTLRCLANWLFRRGYLAEHPMKNLPKPKAKHIEITTLTAVEVKGMLAVAGGLQNPLRDKALITLLIDTGVRIGEATNLQLQNIHWQDAYLVVDGKTGVRQVPFGRKTKAALKVYIDSERTAAHSSVYSLFLRRDGTPLKSTTATQRLAKIADRVGVKASKTGCHIFRHSFAVEYIRAGGDAFTLQRLLGHTTLEMTRRYVHLAQTDLREAHRKFSPGNRML